MKFKHELPCRICLLLLFTGSWIKLIMHGAFCSLSGSVLSHISWTLFTNTVVEPIFQWTRHASTPIGACPRHLHGSFLHPLQVWLKSHPVRETFPNYPFKNVNIYSHPSYPLLCLISLHCTNYFQMYYKMGFLCHYCLLLQFQKGKSFYLFSSLICLEWGPAPNWSSINL